MTTRVVSFLVPFLLITSVAVAGPFDSPELLSPGIAVESDEGLTPLRFVASIEVRDSGFHALFLIGTRRPYHPRDLPDQGCDLMDRAVIKGTNYAGSTLLETAARAQTEGRKVRVKVRGCTWIDGHDTLTAPKVVKIQIF